MAPPTRFKTQADMTVSELLRHRNGEKVETDEYRKPERTHWPRPASNRTNSTMASRWLT